MMPPTMANFKFQLFIDLIRFSISTMSTTQPYVQPGQMLEEFLPSFWQKHVSTAEEETPDYRHPPLPLARIKKVMKSDPDVKMIAADGSSLLSSRARKSANRVAIQSQLRSYSVKPANVRFERVFSSILTLSEGAIITLVFISEITARAFIVADSNKRRTLSRADIAKALTKSDQFDFLIDIVPRGETGFQVPSTSNGAGGLPRKAGLLSGPRQDQDSAQGVGEMHTGPMEMDNGDGTGRTGSEVLEQLETLLGNSNANQHQRGPLS
ncbi:hypothetical protein B0H34DRAFT_199643 [Crassisporium funariophilum]|nr:hypothetical protein B0H34DRAFT_199643 [Crassisporium funariophilum]